MTFENITRILLPKQADEINRVSDDQSVVMTTNPDNERTRRNRLAALSTQSKPQKKAA